MKENDKDIDLKEELEHMNPIFKELKDRLEADIPDGYFNKMQQEVLDHLDGNENTVGKPSRPLILRLWRPLVAVAAVVAVFFIARNTFMKEPDNTTALSEVPATEMVDYLGGDLGTSDMEALFDAGMLTESDLEAILTDDDWSDNTLEPLLEDEEWMESIFDNI